MPDLVIDAPNFDELRAMQSLACKITEELSVTSVSNAFCHSLKRTETILILKSLNLTLSLAAIGDVPNEGNSE